MRDYKRNLTLELKDNKIIEPARSDNDLSGTLETWDLDQLAVIVTSDSIEDDEKRREASYKSRRNSNIFLGAITGGMLDAGMGKDSLVNGVLLGAAFGGVATSGQGEARALVGLIFSDDKHLTLEVDKHEYNELQSIALRNLKRNNFDDKPSCYYRNLTSREIEEFVSSRKMNAVFASYGALFMSIALTILFHSVDFTAASQVQANSSHLHQLFSPLYQFISTIIFSSCALMGLMGLYRIIVPTDLYRSEQERLFAERGTSTP